MKLDGDTEGTHENCECPHCGKNNHYVTRGVAIKPYRPAIYTLPCVHCKKKIYYTAEYVTKVTASTEHPIERLNRPTM